MKRHRGRGHRRPIFRRKGIQASDPSVKVEVGHEGEQLGQKNLGQRLAHHGQGCAFLRMMQDLDGREFLRLGAGDLAGVGIANHDLRHHRDQAKH